MSELADYPVFAFEADEVDERTPGVLLLWRDKEGDTKRTARDDGESWWIAGWERWMFDGTMYWRATEGYRIDKTTVQRLAEAEGTKP